MDALKKAELEKKAAELLKEKQEELAEKQLAQENECQEDKEQQDVPHTQELGTEGSATEIIQRDEEIAASTEHPDKLTLTSTMEYLSLSPAESVEDGNSSIEDLSRTEVSITDPFSIEENDKQRNDEGEDDKTDELEIKSEIDETVVSTIIADQDQILTTTDLHISEASSVLTDNTLHVESLLSATDKPEYSGVTVSAAQLAEDIGGSLTPVAAKTIFTATSRKGDDQMFKWSAFVILFLIIVSAALFLIFNYTVPLERSIESQLVVKDIEIPDKLASVAELNSSSFAGDITDLIEKENNTISEDRKKPAVESNAKTHKYSANTYTSTVDDTYTSTVDDTYTSTVDDTYTSTVDDTYTEIIDDTHEEIQVASDDIFLQKYTADDTTEDFTLSLPEKIIPDPDLVKISRRKSVDKNDILVNKAYEEYLAGNLDSSEKNYRLVLNDSSENHDALLGLAAISLRRGNPRQAYAAYLEVLRLYPKDSDAEVALINFTDNIDYPKSENIIKTFLKSDPDNSFLHYSLARLYAIQRRWSEAQQSFFYAYKIESSNAGYAFNLAVSLEHIGQQQLAVDYYNVALELAATSVASSSTSNFDRAVVISRLNVLSSQANLQ